MEPLRDQRPVAAQKARRALAQLDHRDVGRAGAGAALRPHEGAHALRPRNDDLGGKARGRRAIERRQHRDRSGGPGGRVGRSQHPRVEERADARDADRGRQELRRAERRPARPTRPRCGEADDRRQRQHEPHARPGQPDLRQPALGQRRRLRVGAAGQQQADTDKRAGRLRRDARRFCRSRPHPLRRAAGAEQRRDCHQHQRGHRDPQTNRRVVDADDARCHAEPARQGEEQLVARPHPDRLRSRPVPQPPQPLRDRPRGAPLGVRARPAALDGAQLVGDRLRIHPGAGQ